MIPVHVFIVVALVSLFQGVNGLTAADIYQRLLERERNIDRTFAFNFVKPIGSVAGELIWPRSYSTSAEVVFDENGAAFPVRERPSLQRILAGTNPYRYGLATNNNAYEDYYNNHIRKRTVYRH